MRFFISYARKDSRQLALDLCDALSSPPHSAWVDRKLKAAGDASWHKQIEDNLSSSDYLIVLLSSDINRSPQSTDGESFVFKEIQFFKAKRGESRILVVQVEETFVPLILQGRQLIRFQDLQELVSQICEAANISRDEAPPLYREFIIREEIRRQEKLEFIERQARQAETERQLQLQRIHEIEKKKRQKITQHRWRVALATLSGILFFLVIASGAVLLIYLQTRIPTCDWTGDSTDLPFFGSKIAYQAYDGQSYQIHTLDFDNETDIRLTNGSWNSFYPSWSPDGSQIAFASDQLGNTDIFVMDSDGTNVYNLTSDSASEDTYPRWSPNGSRIAFSSERGGIWNVYIVSRDGSHLLNLTNDSVGAVAADWSPSGDFLLFSSARGGLGTDIFRITDDGMTSTRLTFLSEPESMFVSPSPDGRLMTFNNWSDDRLNYSLYLSDIDGSRLQTLTDYPVATSWLSWLPDSEHLLLSRSDGRNETLQVIDLHGVPVCNLITSTDANRNPDWWSPTS